eukprot:362154-Chlamydomonas_euryale.AAC.6
MDRLQTCLKSRRCRLMRVGRAEGPTILCLEGTRPSHLLPALHATEHAEEPIVDRYAQGGAISLVDMPNVDMLNLPCRKVGSMGRLDEARLTPCGQAQLSQACSCYGRRTRGASATLHAAPQPPTQRLRRTLIC